MYKRNLKKNQISNKSKKYFLNKKYKYQNTYINKHIFCFYKSFGVI